MLEISQIRLSICIATYNRSAYIGETIDSIIGQINHKLEIVIVDGASPDTTPEVVEKYTSIHPNVRYFREITNSGVDADYDKAVGYARGQYCWLMTDDDLMAPGAIRCVLILKIFPTMVNILERGSCTSGETIRPGLHLIMIARAIMI